MEEILEQYGFKSIEEFNHLVSSVDITDANTLEAFKNWQENDGTKESLLKIINNNYD